MNDIDLDKARRIEKLRKELHLTNTQFADLLQVSESQARNYQKCRQPIPDDVIERLSKGNSLLQSWLECRSEYKSVSEIIQQSAAILNGFTDADLKWQNTIILLLQRNGRTQADIGFDSYDKFLSYMDLQIKSAIDVYIKYFKH